MRVQIAAVVLLWCGVVHAGPAPIFLPPQGVEPALLEELEQAFAAVGHPTKRSALQIDELMLAVECSGTTVACLQKIGENIGADRMVYGEVVKTDQGLRLTLRWFDVKSGGDAGRVELVVPKTPGQRGKLLLRSARTLFGVAPPVDTLTGGLRVTANVPNVEILIEGQPRGTVPLELRNLPAKRYKIEARLSSYSNWIGEIEVKADQMTRLEIEMESRGAQLLEDRTPGFLASVRTRTWLVAGLGAGCLVGAIAFGAHMRSQQNKLDNLRGDTFEEIARMEQLKDTGERDALVANVLFGIGGALIATAAVMSYIDHWRARKEGQHSSRAPRDSSTTLEVGVGPRSVMFRGSF